MPRLPNRYGGGANTNLNGLHFEQTTSLNDALYSAGFDIFNNDVYINNINIGCSVPKHELYSKFLVPNGIDYSEINSKKWLPDEAFINYETRTAYIIEKKFQNCSGSVDEKLPGCHFKKREYEKLFNPIDYNVEYIYILSDWFHRYEYNDVLEYISQVGCFYYFNTLPLDALGL